MNKAIIFVGSNIQSEKNIKKALDILAIENMVLKKTDFIKTKPWGGIEQDFFTNGAVLITTDHTLDGLDSYLKILEDKVGRDRSRDKFGPREIDLDIVEWNGNIVDKDYYVRDFMKKLVDQLRHIY